MIEEYLVLLQKVLLQPRTIEVPMETECSLIEAGKISSQDFKRALRNPTIQLYLQHPLGQPPLISKHSLQATNNHPVNQYILWLSMQIARHCTFVIQARIKTILRPIAMLNPQPASDAAFLVLMGDPNYAALHRLGRKILQLARTNQASLSHS